MISYKIIILLGFISSFVCSLDIKRDESIKYGFREFSANVVFTHKNQKSADARLYVNDKYARYDLNLWGEANLTEIIIRDSINPTKATICGNSCDVSVLKYIPAFSVPADAEEMETYNKCPFHQTKNCVLWKFNIDDDLYGFAYVSDEDILAIEIKDSNDEVITQTIFKDIEPTLPNSIFNIPDTCTCRGDICFLIDGSESVLKEDFNSAKEKIAGVLNTQNDMNFDLRLSAVQFATRAHVIVSKTDDKDIFLSSLANNTKLGGLTDIYAGLDECLKELDDNSDREKSIVIITDGSYSNHPQLKGDPRGLVPSIHGKGIGVRVGCIQSELFYNDEVVKNISSSKKSIFLDDELVEKVASKVLNPICASKICKHLDCDVGYCGCGGCICPPGEEGELCRFNSPEFNGPNAPSFNGTDVVPPPGSSSKAGAIVGGIIGALVGIAIIAGIVFAIVRHSRKSAEADAIGGETMTGNESINPVYEQQGVGGENPLYEG